jgi:hypothetical protein
MVRRGGELVPQITPLDPALLSDDHAYAVRLTEQRVEFFIDGAPVGTFGGPPHGKGVNILQKPVPLLGQPDSTAATGSRCRFRSRTTANSGSR